MRPRTHAAVVVGKLTRSATRTLGRGGTAVPGLVAERFDPDVVRSLAAPLESAVLVTGTNGKTTTARMLAEILRADGRAVVHNRAGSNLMRGIAASLLEAVGPLGRLPSASVGVFETDEATIPEAAAAHPPRALVITNLMRDQLDRYGEIEAVRERWVEAIRQLDHGTVLVLNADDPSVATLAEVAPGPVVLYGVEDPAAALPPGSDEPHVADALWDPQSGVDFVYDRRFYAHLGHWQCPGVGRRRPLPDVRGVEINLDPAGVAFGIDCGPFSDEGTDEHYRARLSLPGLYNVYNALAAFTAARVLEVAPDLAAATLGATEAAFGRGEEFFLDGHPVRILLGKNPAGMNEALRTLRPTLAQARRVQPLHLLVLLNDEIADGTDISWIWDTDWESLAPYVASVVVGGSRAADMALRLSYAGFPQPGLSPEDEHDIDAARRRAVEALPPGEGLVVLPTYTALLKVRGRLAEWAGLRAIGDGA